MSSRDDHVDDLYSQFLEFAEYREQTNSAKPMVTGYVSSCCRAETRFLKSGNVACIHCGRQCDTSSWHSSLSGGASRGGWDPDPVWKLTDGDWSLVPNEQTMYVNETRVVNRHAHENRIAVGALRIMFLKYLFDPRPRDMTAADWYRAKLTWRAWLGSRDMQRIAVAMAHGGGVVCFTPRALEQLIGEAREHVWNKLIRAKKRRRSMPWVRAA